MRCCVAVIALGICTCICVAQDQERQSATDRETVELVKAMLAEQSRNMVTEGAGEALVRFRGKEEPDMESSVTWPNEESYYHFKFKGALSRSDEYFYDVKSEQVRNLRSVFVDKDDEVLNYWVYSLAHVSTTDGAVDKHVHVGTDFRPASMFGMPIRIEVMLEFLMEIDTFRVEESVDGTVRLVTEDALSHVVFDPAAGYTIKEFCLHTTPSPPTSDIIWKGTIEYEHTSKGWYPKKVDVTEVYESTAIDYGYKREKRWAIEIKSFDAEAEIDESEFTIESMGIAAGTPVFNALNRDLLYRYGGLGLEDEELMPVLDELLARVPNDALGAKAVEAGDDAAITSESVDASSRQPVSVPTGAASAPGSQEHSGNVAWYAVIAAVLVLAAIGGLLHARSVRSRGRSGR